MPEMQIRNTYYQLGKIYVYKLKVKEACAALKQAEDITLEILGHGDNSNLIYLSKCYGLVKEVHLKAYSQRNPSALDEVDGGELVEEADFDEKHLILGSIQLLIWVIKDLNGLIHALDGLLNLP